MSVFCDCCPLTDTSPNITLLSESLTSKWCSHTKQDKQRSKEIFVALISISAKNCSMLPKVNINLKTYVLGQKLNTWVPNKSPFSRRWTFGTAVNSLSGMLALLQTPAADECTPWEAAQALGSLLHMQIEFWTPGSRVIWSCQL